MKQVLTQKELKWLGELVTVLGDIPETLQITAPLHVFKDLELIAILPDHHLRDKQKEL